MTWDPSGTRADPSFAASRPGTPNFELVADILDWLLHRFEPGIAIPDDISPAVAAAGEVLPRPWPSHG